MTPWWRRVLCALGWHCCEQVTDRQGMFGALYRCVYCGTSDYEDDWVTVWKHAPREPKP